MSSTQSLDIVMCMFCFEPMVDLLFSVDIFTFLCLELAFHKCSTSLTQSGINIHVVSFETFADKCSGLQTLPNSH